MPNDDAGQGGDNAQLLSGAGLLNKAVDPIESSSRSVPVAFGDMDEVGNGTAPLFLLDSCDAGPF